MAGIPIKGQARGNAATAHAKAKQRGAKRLDFTQAYFTHLYADAVAQGINADVLVAQWDLETGAGQSTYWERDGNPGGLAAFDDGSSWGLTFTPAKAARAHVTHMCAYVGITPPEDWIATDARWQAVKDAGFFGTVETTADLGNGRWATDPQYASKLKERYAAYWGAWTPAPSPKPTTPPATEKIVFGRVPKPANIVDDYVDKPRGRGWDDYGPRDLLLAIILHRVLGYAKTTGSYFRTFDGRYADGGHGYNALTDWGICGSMDAAIFGPQWDGKIMDWNRPDTDGLRRSPYASGGTGRKHGDAVAWLARYGAQAINRYGEAIELSGLSNDAPVSDAMMESLINLVAWRVDKKGRIPYHVWPNNNDGVHMLLSHDELGKPECSVPLWVFGRVIDGVRDRLKTYQLVTTTEPNPEPEPQQPDQPASIYPPGMTLELARVLWNPPGGPVTVSWSSKPFDFDPERFECREWLERGMDGTEPGAQYDEGAWPHLVSVTRRYADRSVHAFRFSDGWVLEKRIKGNGPARVAA